jgi:hypothetical protein
MQDSPARALVEELTRFTARPIRPDVRKAALPGVAMYLARRYHVAAREQSAVDAFAHVFFSVSTEGIASVGLAFRIEAV